MIEPLFTQWHAILENSTAADLPRLEMIEQLAQRLVVPPEAAPVHRAYLTALACGLAATRAYFADAPDAIIQGHWHDVAMALKAASEALTLP